MFYSVTGYPFTHDYPVTEPQGNGRYSVSMPNSQEIIGEGTAGEAVEMLINVYLSFGADVDEENEGGQAFF
jgi:hypothetical protein